ncbi:cyclin-dependent kinase inhibitor 3-like [Cynara cardunculus var. scolymus]|uniref:Cyclin-dependent kinase inhibitor n=1 Tax=Cynara cardunculus var. scolymus TaxID=59895 RepID=A0A124SFN6_CYNCS|nr:cyclin-dependent kinase inhibitor 3-like [Cynara cardunculus var. scolymus]KVI03808.1 Cyclin-dependent kinase inhibitor [Cynara cardunculus var. scolymus]
MGKYMRKAKLAGDVAAVMDVSQSSLGVRTRAKTLALQKLQASKSTTSSPPSPVPEHRHELSYLQLRSRRLEKPPFQPLTCCNQQNPNPNEAGSRLVMCSSVSGSVHSVSIGEEHQIVCENQIRAGEGTEESCYFGVEEASFGEDDIHFGGRERSSRESTPCSLIKRDLNAVGTTRSSTRARNLEASSRMTQNSIRSIPLAQEIEEFFARHDQEQQRRFAEKYNFDMVNEKALEGRYEWVRVESQ